MLLFLVVLDRPGEKSSRVTVLLPVWAVHFHRSQITQDGDEGFPLSPVIRYLMEEVVSRFLCFVLERDFANSEKRIPDKRAAKSGVVHHSVAEFGCRFQASLIGFTTRQQRLVISNPEPTS